MHGPKLAFSRHLLSTKYCLPGEDFRAKCNRVAGALSDDNAHFHAYRDITLNMRFLEAGRIQAAMGVPKRVTPYNCFVSTTIDDSMQGIMEALAEASETMRMGGGIGYDFSTLRPRGALIKKLQSRSSGPVSFMDIYDALCRCISSSGHRRGAQMGVIRIDHPDIEEFILAKQVAGRLTGFNISVAVTDEFINALYIGAPFPLRFGSGSETYREVDPRALWELLMRSTWDWAEPGVLFIDTINRMNNLYYCETIAATNPCGEQPLPPYGACLLGSFNLAQYLRTDAQHNFYFDWDQFAEDIPVVVRALDNVVDRAVYPLEGQRREALAKRRMGLGVTALANTAEALGFPYASPEFIQFQLEVLEALNTSAYMASSLLAAEKGAFPLYDPALYLSGEFVRTLPDHVLASIRRHGIRNSHLTSIAPTGTISFCADYVSSGIEPVFEYEGRRLVNMPEGEQWVDVSDYGLRELGVKGRLATTISPAEHLDVLSAAASMVDSSVSKTVTMDGRTTPWQAFKNLYLQAWERGCKGCTTFNRSGQRMGILLGVDEATTPVDPPVYCEIQPDGSKDCG